MIAPTIDPEFQALIPKLTPEEFIELENQLLRDGCRDSLTLWGDILIDGHNRYKICKRRGIKFGITYVELADRDEARVWIIDRQLGRRNLTPFSRVELQLKKKEILATAARKRVVESGKQTGRGNKKVGQNSAQPLAKTRDKIAKAANVSHDTVSRVERLIQQAPATVLEHLRKGETSVNEAYKTVQKESRKQQQKEKLALALSAVKGETTTFVVTADQTPIHCTAIITDPPYGILDEPWEPKERKKFTQDWLSRWNDSGADYILSFFSQEYQYEGREWFIQSLTNYEYRQTLIWRFTNNVGPGSSLHFKRTWEPIFYFVRKGVTRGPKPGGADWGDDIHSFDSHEAAVPQSNFNNADYKQHPTQKPLSVMRWLVNAVTLPGELVVDPFSGSGTTGIAALELGRQFYGIEIDPNFRKLSEQRIALYGRAIKEDIPVAPDVPPIPATELSQVTIQ